jgi:2-methylisocitrate lyase-like PEP mutase family enzyme
MRALRTLAAAALLSVSAAVAAPAPPPAAAPSAEEQRAAIERANAYAAAGADLIFVEAPTSREELARIAREVEAPLVVNMTEGGRTPLIARDELAALGFKVALYPNALLRAELLAGQAALAHLRTRGSTQAILDRLLPWDERQRLVDLGGYQELERRFVLGEG